MLSDVLLSRVMLCDVTFFDAMLLMSSSEEKFVFEDDCYLLSWAFAGLAKFRQNKIVKKA